VKKLEEPGLEVKVATQPGKIVLFVGSQETPEDELKES
jgi:hypothetical protein